MAKLHFEDFTTGTVTDYGPRLVTRDEMIAFAAEFDPQPMHLDDEAARSSILGGLAGSGWHMCCVTMRLIVDGFLLNSTSMGAPGVDEVRWMRPLRPDTSVTVRVTVLETRPSASRPERGFVKFRCDLRDAAGRTLMRLSFPAMFARREAAAGGAA